MSRPPAVATLCLLLTAVPFGAVGAEDRSREEPDAAPPIGSATRSDVLLLGAQTLFASGMASLSGEAEAGLARLLERLPGHGEVVAIRVVGYTDSVGPASGNLRLSERRASAVADAVVRRYPGVPMAIEGAGEQSPVASNGTPAGRARNRRVEIHVISIDAGGEAPAWSARHADE